MKRYESAQRAFRELCAIAPSPHALKLWGLTSVLTNRSEEALSASRMLVARSPGDPVGWFLLWGSAKVASDTSLVRSTEAKLQHWQEGGPELKNVIAFLDHYPVLYRALALSPN